MRCFYLDYLYWVITCISNNQLRQFLSCKSTLQLRTFDIWFNQWRTRRERKFLHKHATQSLRSRRCRAIDFSQPVAKRAESAQNELAWTERDYHFGQPLNFVPSFNSPTEMADSEWHNQIYATRLQWIADGSETNDDAKDVEVHTFPTKSSTTRTVNNWKGI